MNSPAPLRPHFHPYSELLPHSGSTPVGSPPLFSHPRGPYTCNTTHSGLTSPRTTPTAPRTTPTTPTTPHASRNNATDMQ